MTTCMFKSSNQEANNKLMDSIWEAVRDWTEYGRKEVTLCRWQDKNGFHVALSIDDSVKASVSISFEASEKTGKYYELILLKGEEKRVAIPANVVAQIYYEKGEWERRDEDQGEK